MRRKKGPRATSKRTQHDFGQVSITVLGLRPNRLRYSMNWACSMRHCRPDTFPPFLACLQGQQAPVADTVGRRLRTACLDSTGVAPCRHEFCILPCSVFFSSLASLTLRCWRTHAWVHCFVVSSVRQGQPKHSLCMCACVYLACRDLPCLRWLSARPLS